MGEMSNVKIQRPNEGEMEYWNDGLPALPELGQGADARVGQGMMEEWVITNVKIQSSNECQSPKAKRARLNGGKGGWKDLNRGTMEFWPEPYYSSTPY